MQWNWLLVPATAVFCFHAELAPVRHPHFQKVLECRVAKDVTITLRYQTATFDAEGAKKMEAGKAWHLAGAVFETTGALDIGGQRLEAGAYALSARKLAAKEDAAADTAPAWELVLHDGRGFSLPPAEGAIALATTIETDAPLFEHLSIDVHPAGDKLHTRLNLDVRFDTLLARTSLEIPAK